MSERDEDAIEAAYWRMDSLRQRHGERWAMPERDAFKSAVRTMLAELKSLRAAQVTSEDREALAHARVIVNAADCGDVADEPLRQRAIGVLDRLTGVTP